MVWSLLSCCSSATILPYPPHVGWCYDSCNRPELSSCLSTGAVSGTAKVSCTTANGQPLSAGTSYTVGLTANYQCNNAAASSKTTAEFRVVDPVTASLLRQGPSSLSVCQHKGSPLSVSFEQRYRVVSDQVEQQAGATPQSPSMTAISSVSGVTCTAEMKEGEFG